MMLNDNPHDEHQRGRRSDFLKIARATFEITWNDNEAPLAALMNEQFARNHTLLCRTCRAEIRDMLRAMAYRTGYAATLHGASDFAAIWPWVRLVTALPR